MKTNCVITIGRQFGSGGRYVGRMLAEKLGIPFYDKELLSEAAKQSGICEEIFEDHDEKPTRSLLFNLVTGMQVHGDAGSYYMDMPLNHKIFLAQFDAIRSIADKGPCVIVGRCADYVLKDRPNTISVFLKAEMQSKVERAVKYYGVDPQKAEDRIARRISSALPTIIIMHRNVGRREQLRPVRGHGQARRGGHSGAHRPLRRTAAGNAGSEEVNMSKTLRRAALLVLMTMLVCAVAWASGDIDWDTPAAGQNLSGNAAVERLKDYIRGVNETLVSSGAGKIDPCYELYPTFASLGLNGAEFAQHAEITVNMNATGITSLVLRMDNLTNFALIGGALVQQTSPNSITLDEAVSAVQAYVRKVQESNGNGVVESFEEQPILSQGTQTRLYGAYYPNQYHDNANWMQLTIIFPQPGSVDGGLLLNNDAGPTATPDPDGDEISGYFPFDGFQDSHLEVFVTPTPEPDSAAM